MNGKEFNCIIYIIMPGDTLYSISRRYNVPIPLILRENPFVDVYNLQIGDELCVPTLAPITRNSMIDYVIEEEDTLLSILTKFGIELEDLLQYNDLNAFALQPGMIIQIPVFEE